MSRLSAVLDLMEGKPSSSPRPGNPKRSRENDSKEVARPTKLPRHDPKPTKPSSVVPKDPVAVALDEERAVRVIAIELDFLMGRRTAAVPLALLRNEWRQLPKGDTTPRMLLSLNDAPQGLVSSPSLCASITSLLRSCTFVAVDCEWSGDNLSTVQIASPSAHVFVFDVLGEGREAMFASGLRELLEDDGVVKVLHDCRQDALFLSRSSVDLKPVIDTQIAFAFVTRLRTSRTPLPCGLNTVLRVFAQGSENQYKERARALMEANKEIWSIRPLDEILLAYAMDDVRALPRAYANAVAAIGDVNMPLVREYSTAYSKQLRDLSPRELLEREERLTLAKEGGDRPLPKYNIARWDEEAASTLRGQRPST